MDAHLNDLIIRLAEAIGPDRELDAAIAEALSLIPQTHERAMNHGRPQAYYWHKHNHKGDYWTPPAYTASIDAALTLVPKGWGVVVRRWADGTGRGVAHCYPPEGSGDYCHGATPALAICIAALRAKEAE